jgi:hypothetical protein
VRLEGLGQLKKNPMTCLKSSEENDEKPQSWSVVSPQGFEHSTFRIRFECYRYANLLGGTCSCVVTFTFLSEILTEFSSDKIIMRYRMKSNMRFAEPRL